MNEIFYLKVEFPDLSTEFVGSFEQRNIHFLAGKFEPNSNVVLTLLDTLTLQEIDKKMNEIAKSLFKKQLNLQIF